MFQIRMDDPSQPASTPQASRRLPVWAIMAVVATFVAIERLCMVMFVTDAGPITLAISATLFVSVVLTVLTVGAWLFSKNFGK